MAVDQHAADERVRLEHLRDRVLAAAVAACNATPLAVDDAGEAALAQTHLNFSFAVLTAFVETLQNAASGVPVDSVASGVDHKATTELCSAPSFEHSELLGSETIGNSPAGCLSHSEQHLYEAYQDQVERCVCRTRQLSCQLEHLLDRNHLTAATLRWGWKADLRAAATLEVVAVPRILNTVLTATDLKVTVQSLQRMPRLCLPRLT